MQLTRRLLTVLGNALPDAVASPVADAIRYYRRATGRREYDQHVTQVVHELAPFDIRTKGIDASQSRDRRPRTPTHFRRLLAVTGAYIDNLHTGRFIYRPGLN